MRGLTTRAAALGLAGVSLDADTRVFDAGLLDSLGLLDLVAEVERDCGQTVDMLRFDPAEVESVGELVTALLAALPDSATGTVR